MSGLSRVVLFGSAAAQRKLGVLLAVCCIVLSSVGVYWNSLDAPFIFDDFPSIRDNTTIRDLASLGTVLSPPPEGSGVTGRPIVNLSLALNYAIGGLEVGGYHWFNVILHTMSGLVLFGLVRRTLTLPTLKEKFGERATLMAMIIAVIWCVHPLQTESVTCVIQRTELLFSFWYLLTFYLFVLGVDERSHRRISPGSWHCLAVISCLLGMASKEVMVSAPLVVLLYDRTFVAGTFREAWRLRWLSYVGLAATWGLLAYLVIDVGGSRGAAAGFGLGISWWSYLLKQCEAIVLYVKLAFWPYPLVLDYGTAVVLDMREVFFQGIAILLAVIATVYALFKHPMWGFAGMWFFCILAPSSSFVPLVSQTMAEHRMYLPLAMIAAIVVLGSYALLKNRATGLWLAISITLGITTVLRNKDYSSSLSLWTDTVTKWPSNSRAHYNLGIELTPHDRNRAKEHYRTAIRLKSDYAAANYNLGLLYIKDRDFSSAISFLEAAVRMAPHKPEYHRSLGRVYALMGKSVESLNHLLTAQKLAPALKNGGSNRDLDDIEEGIRLLEQQVQRVPDKASNHNNLGRVYAKQGRAEESLEYFRNAHALDPKNAGAAFNYGLQLLNLKRAEEALDPLTQAVLIIPDNFKYRVQLSRALRGVGRFTEANEQLDVAAGVLRGDEAENKLLLARELMITGRKLHAVRLLKDLAREDPSDPKIRSALKEAEAD